MQMNFRRGTRGEEPEINLIPLIDVVLVIIIFLMLTTTFSKVSGLEINLPTGVSAETETVANEINVAINAAGDVLVNRQPVGDRSIEAIAAALGKAVPARTGDPVIVISVDAKAAHQSVINVMQAAQRAGLAHITFATQTPAK
jgi:biopolymer transport protein ExbD